MSDRFKSLCFYKARSGPDISGGSAIQMQLGSNKDCIFLEIAKQIAAKGAESRMFDWDNKLRVKLGQADIGKMLEFIDGRAGETLDLFHQNEKGNKVIKLAANDRGIYMKISSKEADKMDSVAITLAWDEARLTKLALEKGFQTILGW